MCDCRRMCTMELIIEGIVVEIGKCAQVKKLRGKR